MAAPFSIPPVDKQFTINIIDVQYATTTTVNSSTNPALLNQAVTFTAQVTAAAGSGIVGGSVTFKDGATIVQTVTLNGAGQATFTTSALPNQSNTASSASTHQWITAC